MQCAWKICVKEVKPGRRFCSPQCKRKFFVDKRRKDLKQQALEYKGKKCKLCGYSKCEEALAFHHLDAKKKDFAISGDGFTRSWKRIQQELDKCILICANCHAELHHRQRLRATSNDKNRVNSVNGEVPPTPSQSFAGRLRIAKQA